MAMQIDDEGNLVPFERPRTDTQIATDYRDRATSLLAPLVDLINEARRDGMQINFQIGPPDGFNRQSLVLLEITKKLC